jgi:hypothetical protein
MAIGYMVNYLAHCPAAVAVGGVKLRVVETAYCRAETLGKLAKGFNVGGAVGREN